MVMVESWRPVFKVLMKDQEYAKVVRRFAFKQSKFSIERPGLDTLYATGSRTDSVFKIEKNDQMIASINRTVISEGGSYAVDIHAADGNIDIIAAAVVFAWSTM